MKDDARLQQEVDRLKAEHTAEIHKLQAKIIELEQALAVAHGEQPKPAKVEKQPRPVAAPVEPRPGPDKTVKKAPRTKAKK